jgi:hypothetical protein
METRSKLPWSHPPLLARFGTAIKPFIAHTDIPQQPKRRNRARKPPKFVPFDFEAATTMSKFTAPDEMQAVQQLEGLALDPSPKSHTKAATPSKQSTTVDPVLPAQVHDSVAKKSRTNRKKHPKGRPPGGSRVGDMNTRLQGVYLPPHLRKRTTAPVKPKTDVKLDDSIGIGSPPVSVKSQSDKPVQLPASS